MYWDVVEVKPEPDYCLFVQFKDGLTGRVQLRREELTGALAPLRMCSFSSRFSLITAQSRGPARSIWRRMLCTLRSPASVMSRSRQIQRRVAAERKPRRPPPLRRWSL